MEIPAREHLMLFQFAGLTSPFLIAITTLAWINRVSLDIPTFSCSSGLAKISFLHACFEWKREHKWMYIVLSPRSVLFSVYASRPQASATWIPAREGKACNRKRSLLVLYGLACCLLKMPQNWASSGKMRSDYASGLWESRPLFARLSWLSPVWLTGIRSS